MSDEILINVKGPSELKLQISITSDKTVLELKQAIAAKTDVEAERQRLIYSGRVLKDEDLLSVYKIQSSHTIHMVKGVSRAGNASTTSQASSAPQPLPPMQAGQNPHDPLTQLNSHMGFGAMAGLNPFGDMGLNPNDPNMMQSMLSNPQFMQQMSSLMSNPAVLESIIASNPQMAGMGDHVRQVVQSEQFREMISNPERLQQMIQMSQMFQNAGLGPNQFGNPFGANPSFPSPGNPTTPSNTITAGQPTTTPTPTSPNAGSVPPIPNPFTMDPAMMQMFMSGMGGGGNTFGAPAAPADTRAPEERFQVQLQQLQDMGFTNASQNVRALLATGGNVHSAIEYILSGGGL